MRSTITIIILYWIIMGKLWWVQIGIREYRTRFKFWNHFHLLPPNVVFHNILDLIFFQRSVGSQFYKRTPVKLFNWNLNDRLFGPYLEIIEINISLLFRPVFVLFVTYFYHYVFQVNFISGIIIITMKKWLITNTNSTISVLLFGIRIKRSL